MEHLVFSPLLVRVFACSVSAGHSELRDEGRPILSGPAAATKEEA